MKLVCTVWFQLVDQQTLFNWASTGGEGGSENIVVVDLVSFCLLYTSDAADE